MPSRIEPCLALLVPKPPSGSQWAFEIKWDGYRLAVHKDPSGVKILTRGGHDWTHRFPAIAAAVSALPNATLILDGEAVVLDDQGKSDFGLLQQALGGRGGKRRADEAIFYAFDLLYLDEHDLTELPLSERRELLKGVIPTGNGILLLSEEMEADGQAFFNLACEHGLEGIIGKRRDLPYRSGRRGDWVKVKCTQSDSFAVVGYEPSTAVSGAVARLLLAAKKDGRLVYVGGVGTGWSHREAVALKNRLSEMRTDKPPVVLKRKNAVFVKPELVAEIEYRAWTHDGKLRHASYKGLREAADEASVYEIEVG